MAAEIKHMKINRIKSNQDNPRYIKDDKFDKLVKSIEDFPEMLDLRPIVVDETMTVLGGNMRLQAAKKAGLTEVPIMIAKGLTEEQKKEFIIKDNASFGDWDWDVLANEWDTAELGEWGIDVWQPTPEEEMFDIGDEETEEDEKQEEPKATSDDYSIFEIVMLHDNKIKLLNLINEIKNTKEFEKQEDAIMDLVNNYKF